MNLTGLKSNYRVSCIIRSCISRSKFNFVEKLYKSTRNYTGIYKERKIMGITITQIQDPKLRELAAKVDESFSGETKSNKVLDDCELSVFAAQAKAAGLETEYDEFLKVQKQTSVNEKVFDVNSTAAEKARLEEKVKTAKEKVDNLREQLEYMEKNPNAKRKKYVAKWGLGGFGAIGGVIGIASILGFRHNRISGALSMGFWGGGAGMLLTSLVGLGVYYLTKHKNDKEEYTKEYAQTLATLKAAEMELQKSEVELQHFMNNL